MNVMENRIDSGRIAGWLLSVFGLLSLVLLAGCGLAGPLRQIRKGQALVGVAHNVFGNLDKRFVLTGKVTGFAALAGAKTSPLGRRRVSPTCAHSSPRCSPSRSRLARHPEYRR